MRAGFWLALRVASRNNMVTGSSGVRAVRAPTEGMYVLLHVLCIRSRIVRGSTQFALPAELASLLGAACMYFFHPVVASPS